MFHLSFESQCHSSIHMSQVSFCKKPYRWIIRVHKNRFRFQGTRLCLNKNEQNINKDEETTIFRENINSAETF